MCFFGSFIAFILAIGRIYPIDNLVIKITLKRLKYKFMAFFVNWFVFIGEFKTGTNQLNLGVIYRL